MITQFVENLPQGMSTPDFTRKPIALTIQEGKTAIFRSIVTGNPSPNVTWTRSKGDLSDGDRFKIIYETISGEYQLQMPDVGVDQAGTYKCFAENEYGKAVVTATLNIIEGKRSTTSLFNSIRENVADFKNLLKTGERQKEDRLPGEPDEHFWELLLSADRKDYERICAEYGVTDFRWMLKKLNEKKREREEEQAQFVEHLSNLKPIEIKTPGCAEFEFEMELKDQNSRIFLYKVQKSLFALNHSLKQIGRKFVFSVKDLDPEDAGLYQVDVEGVNVFSTDFKIPSVDFLVKIQEVKAIEREDAVFECVLSNPMPQITWLGKNVPLQQGEKHDITVSEDKLIHRLVVKDCLQLDKGIYTAVVGIKSCNAWLVVEADNDPSTHGKKKARKTTQAGGGGADLAKIAAEQNAKIQKAREEMLEKMRQERAEMVAAMAENGEEAVAEAVTANQDAVRPSVLLCSPDPGVHFTRGLEDVKAIIGCTAELICKLSKENIDGVWYKDGEELSSSEDVSLVRDGAFHKLVIRNCKEEDSGKYRFEADGRKTEAMLTVEDPPRINPDDLAKFSEPVIIKTGQNASFQLSFVGQEPLKIQWYNEDEEVLIDNHVRIEKSSTQSRLILTKCVRKQSGEIKIKIKNVFGTIEATTKLTVLDKPTPPQNPVEIVEASSHCVEIKWRAPKDNGGSPIINYNLERQQLGRNTWKKIGMIPGIPHYKDTDVDHGRKYCYRIRAVTAEGTSEVMETDDIQAGTKAYPGPPSAPKVVSAFKDCINLSWTPPANTGGTNIVGYNLEKRKRGSNLWGPVNPPEEPIKAKQVAVKDVVEGIEYEFRVSAINFSGAGEPSPPSEFVFARDPKMRPNFTDRKLKTFLVIRAGNSARVNINFVASPLPTITWLKDGMAVSKRVTISNTEGSSQLLIPSSERLDTGVYSIVVSNLVGQETCSIEIRVTDDPKPPGPVELEQNVPGTVTLSWTPSPDEKRDDRLHYMVAKRDSVKQTWRTVADHLYNNKFTVANILPGREFLFRVYAKNDMGVSEPTESNKWEVFILTLPESKNCKFEAAPSFLLPLKKHSNPPGYECYMSCAVKGDPAPHITWYRDNVSLNTNTNYYISNTCGVCSLLILRVGPKDTGEYKVVAESPLGRAECSTTLTVRGKHAHMIYL
uniref:Immunoglobulin like and fibronectin type III domain containing 1, tandem duplicate 3 n=1 Tax=Denticeps clupeoides TaxID=299321 RepID=A0AAY4BS72_9TELE